MKLGAAVILIGHDMGFDGSSLRDRVGVMYAGKLVEEGPMRRIFQHPKHPYTQNLIKSLPTLERKSLTAQIRAKPPNLLRPPSGCVFPRSAQRWQAA
jgi:oligopeptide/dipeptide ABC transporter ATP-binding protein